MRAGFEALRREVRLAARRVRRRPVLRLSIPVAAAGLLLAAPAVEAVRGAIAGVPRVDAPTFAVIACVAVAATLVSTMVPARRAARVDPVIALRAE
jgi:putative ABC transport system permease protein